MLFQLYPDLGAFIRLSLSATFPLFFFLRYQIAAKIPTPIRGKPKPSPMPRPMAPAAVKPVEGEVGGAGDPAFIAVVEIAWELRMVLRVVPL